MTDDTSMQKTTMLGTYTLDGDVPVEPEIVLANCTDTAMLGQLVSVFQDTPDIRFFLIANVSEDAVDFSSDLHFLKDDGNWVLANENSLLTVLFDTAHFNQHGTQETFSLIQENDGAWSIVTDDIVDMADTSSTSHLLVDLEEDTLLTTVSLDETDSDQDSFFIDPSVLEHGENEIIVSNFTVGSHTLEFPEGMSVKDVIVDTKHDLTEVIVSQNDTDTDDIVVKLLGVSQPDLPMHDYGLDTDSTTDDLINHLIQSGMNTD
ncbi:hypothetical protein GO013_02515 [Pseudodesulfovibrio sp. JC047]|uniref:hypothetical protein n=1 Tax=Pseudodesulfovibrio sp. JC047 TaxID=2683199 RepID=UPI0013D8C860|nr:hypothetical protein [Pseudodesulfovibrio sp. JC047]NDV18288.1 hypothetical protein [Pseudodesulfovibrio sp. JC047]